MALGGGGGGGGGGGRERGEGGGQDLGLNKVKFSRPPPL